MAKGVRRPFGSSPEREKKRMAEGVKLTGDHRFVRPEQNTPPKSDDLSVQESRDAALGPESSQG